MKRLMDMVLVILGAPIWIPLFLITGLLVFFASGLPVFFRQERAGIDGKPFTIIKFRTMNLAVDSSGKMLPDAERFTPLGKLLRSFSLDEIPELWHVLCGQMSLVGPRPLPVAYVERYSPDQARRLFVRPGITGLAQVNGRNALDWPERFKLDAWYVDHRSLWLDWKILFKTVLVVLQRQGISADGEVTMHEFKGDPPEQS